MLAIAPDATFVDITHDIPPQDVLAAALELSGCYRFFPAGTVFLVVVDPGVGTSRRPIGARAGEYAFVAPDNGVLAPVLADHAAPVVVELREPRYARSEISRTFEGRDRFAPAAAWLALGTDIGEFGPTVADIQALPMPVPRRDERTVAGEILKADRFGNLVSNIHRRLFDTLAQPGSTPVVTIGGRRVPAMVATYGDVPPGAVCALFGSGGYLEIAASGDSAARLLGLGRGARVIVAADAQALDEIERIR
jgi:S-adenosylmethionine hydrolase